MLQLFVGLLLQSLFLFFLVKVVKIISDAFFTTDSEEYRLSAKLVLASWILSVFFSVLIPFELFKPIPATLFLGLCWIFLRAIRPDTISRNEPSFFTFLGTSLKKAGNSNIFIKISLFIFLYCLIFHILRNLALPLSGWDTMTYHGLKSGAWVQTGGWLLLDAPGAWEGYKTFLGGGEAFTAWSMLFLRSDALAGLPEVFFWLFLALISFCLGVQSGLNKATSFAVSVAFTASFEVCRIVGTGYVDTSATVFLFSGVFFSIQYIRKGEFFNACIALGAFGVAASIKVNSMATSIVYVAFWSLIAIKRKLFSIRKWLVLSLIWLSPVVQWLIFNFYISGYPLGCVPVNIGKFVIGALPPNLIWFFARPDILPYTFSSEFTATFFAVVYFGISLTLVALSIPGFIRNFAANFHESLLKLIFSGTVLALYFSPSFSVIRHGWAFINGRFIAPAIILFAISSLHNLQKFRSGKAVIEGISAVAVVTHCMFFIRFCCYEQHSIETYKAILAIILTIIFYIRLTRMYSHAGQASINQTKSRLIPIFILFALPIATFYFKNWFRLEAYKHIENFNKLPKQWYLGANSVYKETAPLHIAFAYGPEQSGHKVFIAPFLGERFQNKISYITPEKSGKIIYYHPKNLRDSRPDFASWLERLKEKKVTHLVTFYPESHELKWAEQNPQYFTRLEGSGKAQGLYKTKFD